MSATAPLTPTRTAVPPPSEAFTAIASPVRRHILDMLTEGELPVNELAASFAMSRPAISQHLRILLAAGLVAEHRHGRENRYRLVPESLAPVREWIRHYERFWDDHLARLQSVLHKRAAAHNSIKTLRRFDKLSEGQAQRDASTRGHS